MQYLEIKENLKKFIVISRRDILKVDPDFHDQRLSEWQKKGYIKKVVKGYYIFSDLEINEYVLFEIANKIYNPSYISSEMALSYYHFIPESVYGITSVSTRRTYSFKTPIAEFIYKTIKPQLFLGYELIKYNNNKYIKIASLEKAILDYFYLHSDIKGENDFASLRLNKEIFLKEFNEEKLNKFLERFAQKSLTKRIESFGEFMKNA